MMSAVTLSDRSGSERRSVSQSGVGDLSVEYAVHAHRNVHTHAEFQLLVPLAGDALQGQYQSGTGPWKRATLDVGSVHLIEPQQPHVLAGENLEMVSLYFSRQTLDRVASDIVQDAVSLSDWFGLDDALLRRLGLAVRDHYVEHGRFSRIFVESTCYVAAGQLIERLSRRVGRASVMDVSDARVRAACDLINERLGENLTLGDLAAAAGLSHYHFLRTFRATTGQTPQRYILRQRVDRARERLIRDRETISTIAADLAFASPSHLARAFRARFGTTPREYRRLFGLAASGRP